MLNNPKLSPMKKLLYILTAIVSLTACDPAKWMYSDQHRWYVKNTSDETIIVRMRIYSRLETLSPGDSTVILQAAPQPDEKSPNFELLYNNMYWDNGQSQDQQINILSKSGKVLKTWKYTEQKKPDKQFFRESSWTLYSCKGAAESEYSWVFEIFPEDIGATTHDNTGKTD